MSGCRLSVALCTYNGERFLGQQLDSLLGQTLLPHEIVVGDDASTDGTWGILQAFALRAGELGVQVRLLRRERNLGFVRNFSETLRQVTGDIVFLCDQDDAWLPEKIATMADRFRADPPLWLLCTDAWLVAADGSRLGGLFEALELAGWERRALHEGRGFDVLLRRSMATGATAAFRRELLDVALPVGEGWVHDEWLAIVAAVAGRVDLLDHRLIDYRQHGGNQIGMRRRGLAEKWADLLRPREVQFRHEVGRLQALEAHLARLPAGTERLGSVAARRRHFERRLALGRRGRLARIPAIVREAWRGDYRRYGTGLRSMFRDLLRHD